MTHPDKKQLLLDAAQKRFAYYGISKATMDEIAADVGLSKAAIYYYFKTKEEIFREVVVRELELFGDEMKRRIDEKQTACEKLSAFIHDRFKAAERMQNFKKASCEAGLDLRTHLGDTFAEYRRKERFLIADILKIGTDSGEFSVASAKKTALLIQHLVLGIVNARFRLLAFISDTAKEMSDEEENGMLADLIIKGITKRNRSPGLTSFTTPPMERGEEARR